MLKAEYRKTVDLDLLRDNPRIISDESFEKLCESLRKNKSYFECRPIILSDRTGFPVVIAGNQRLRAAVHLGMNEVPTVLIPNLTEQEEKEIIIRDNVSNGGWDFDLLARDFEPIDLEEWGVDLPTPGSDIPDDDEDIASAITKMVVKAQSISDLEKLFHELENRGFTVELK